MKTATKTYFGIISAVLCMLVLSCNKEEPIPSYIHIDKINLTTTYTTEGSSSHKIMDAWIYVDDQLIGAFEMPCTVPVLFSGSHVVKVFAGIKENGIAATRIAYPFYSLYETTVSLSAGQITTISPSVVYDSGTTFTWIEDFDVIHSLCNSAGTTDTIMKIINSPDPNAFEGGGSGMVSLTASSSPYYGQSCTKYTVPQNGLPVFVELNYNCNTEFNVGVACYNGNSLEVQTIVLVLNPTTGWNKTYVNLTNAINSAATSDKFSVFFSMVKNPSVSTSYLYLDNVKFIN